MEKRHYGAIDGLRMIAAFGMCCGYYDKILKGRVDFAEFYGKRFKKILPFSELLCFWTLSCLRRWRPFMKGLQI